MNYLDENIISSINKIKEDMKRVVAPCIKEQLSIQQTILPIIDQIKKTLDNLRLF